MNWTYIPFLHNYAETTSTEVKLRLKRANFFVNYVKKMVRCRNFFCLLLYVNRDKRQLYGDVLHIVAHFLFPVFTVAIIMGGKEINVWLCILELEESFNIVIARYWGNTRDNMSHIILSSSGY